LTVKASLSLPIIQRYWVARSLLKDALEQRRPHFVEQLHAGVTDCFCIATQQQPEKLLR
jgi:hypothetical protein